MELELRCLDGSQQLLALPDGDSLDMQADIDKAADAICVEYERRRTAKNHADENSLGRWLLPPCLIIIEHCETRMQLHHLIARLAREGRYSERESMVHRAMAGLFAVAPTFTSNDVRRYGNKIFYAMRHYVPAVFVNGFFSQLGTFDRSPNLENIEPGFEEWIVARRFLQMPPSRNRGRYPVSIESKGRRLRDDFAEAVVRIGQAVSPLHRDE